jgi:hypothetical protein
VADGFAVEQHARRVLGPVVFDLGVARDEGEVALVFQVGLAAQRRHPDRPVHGPGVEKIKPEPLRDGQGHRRFPGPRRTVDRDDHTGGDCNDRRAICDSPPLLATLVSRQSVVIR